MKHALVTGVSSGIGRAIAVELAKAGCHVFGSVRNDADGLAFEQALEGKGTAVVFDVTDRSAVEAGAARIGDAVGDEGLSLLVNNAGMSRNGPLQHIDLEDFRAVLDVNTIGLVSVTQVFLPLLGAHAPNRADPGRIINISSVGGRVASPFMSAYCASKFAVEAISDSLRRELMLFGIDVIVIEPGAIQSEIWEKVRQEDISRFEGTPYYPALQKASDVFVAESEASALPARTVGRLAVRIAKARRPKTRYVIQRGGPWSHYLMRLLPDRTLDRAVARRLGFGGS